MARPIITCGTCGLLKPHHADGNCKACYMSGRRSAAFLTTEPVVAGITHGRYGYEERGCRCEVCVGARRAMWARGNQARSGRAARDNAARSLPVLAAEAARERDAS